jgi:hypothetical protein
MRKLILIFCLFLLTVPLWAQEGQFNLGVMLGNPTGVSARYHTGQRTALDASFGYHFRKINHLVLTADFVGSPWTFRVEGDEFRIFLGAGLGLGFLSDLGLSLRLPAGITHHLEDPPLELFAELVPTIQLTGPDNGFWLDGCLGVRWCF